DNFWAPRLYPHGSIKKYLDYEGFFLNYIRQTYAYLTNASWIELGPVRNNDNDPKFFRGIGPTEFVEIYNDGTSGSTLNMLTASLPGGLFYTNNGGLSWTNAGTDAWERSGVGSAVFNPKNVNHWYASSSGGGLNGRSVFIGKTGGIYRTLDKGANWSKIADYQNLNGIWSIIYKIAINPS
ncbi:hypothetical protein RZS08_14885, partial [Arthrospira platensis SPKY1]|nr:hypothetical protein [Arthrospira platensis SPKY1]